MNPDAIIIDVRTAEEFAQGHLSGATRLDITNGEFLAALPALDPKAQYLLYCRSGNRSGLAQQAMLEAGFSSVTNLGSVTEAADTTGIHLTD